MDSSEKIVATTKVSIPQGDGPIEATSTIEALPNTFYNQIEKIGSAEQPYKAVENNDKYSKNEKMQNDSPPITPYRRSMKLQKDYPLPSAPPLQEINTNQKLLFNLQGKQHEFSSRTILRTDACSHCLKA